ncbi:uncharacterized protein IL334_000930 [Kwoniella shivajii]|uniref:Uncharacterized protein n=1 Tax=Kwoniella shivajii TaxID=564305 RepID=A0ABZ1CR43_9TREE|nr:hypothetical protein IL334_000930 [Kwoniella shivajii]
MSGGPYPWSMYRGLWSPLPAAPKGAYLKGKIVIITGATSGVGLEATKQMAKASPEQLILAVRNLEAGAKILASIKKSEPKLNGKVMYLDLADLNSIKTFAEETKTLKRVDLLVNNAGVNPNFDDAPYKATNDGYERTFQVNVLAPFLTTILLLPLLKQSSSPQVIFSGSDTHFVAPSEPVQKPIEQGRSIIEAYNDASIYNNGKRYFESKLLLQMITRSMIKQIPSINTINVNPGLAMTNLGRDFNFSVSFKTVYEVVWFLLNARSAGKAARNLTSAAAWGGGSQDYWSECGPAASENMYLYSAKGLKATQLFYEEMVKEVNKISPGCTNNLI